MDSSQVKLNIYVSRLTKDERVSLKYEIPNYYPPVVVFEVFDPRGIYQNGLESFTVNITLKLNESFPSGVVLHVDVEKFLDNAKGLNTAYASPYWVQIYFDSSSVTGQGSAVVYDGGYTSGNNDAINWTDIYLHSGYNSTYMKFKVYGQIQISRSWHTSDLQR